MSGHALITGAEGFVGGHLSAHLRNQGWKVTASSLHGGEHGIACDVTSASSLHALLEQAPDVTHIFHLAAVTFVPEANRNPEAAFEVNLLGVSRFLEVLRARASKARFLYIGSADAYGPPLHLPVAEEHPMRPANPYAISKAAADQLCAFIAHTTTLDIVRIRPFNHSGPGQANTFVLSSFAEQIARAELEQGCGIIRVGNLSAARDFSHVTDVVRAYELLAHRGEPGEAYNVCSGTARSIQSALDAMLSMAASPISIESDPGRHRPLDVPEVVGSHAKLTARTGWTPEVPFDTLLRDLIESWRTKIASNK